MSLEGKVAIITGATKGIGKATAELLIKRGAKVVVTYAGDKASADAFVKEHPESLHAIQGNAGDLKAIDAIIEGTIQKFGRIDIVIPNAAVLQMKSLETTTPEDFDNAYTTNVKGPFFLVQKALPHMAPGGSVIFLSSSQASNSMISPPYLLYNSTKGAIEQLIKVGSKELALKGIRVNGVAPGPTATELFFRGKPESLVNTIKAFSPFNRLGEPAEIASVIASLVSDEMSWVSGQLVRVNGAFAV